uniref:Putative protease n=1 Tax=viral metagenome TaxID=1070528 RepID=A0A6M3LN45_9ZZZZ
MKKLIPILVASVLLLGTMAWGQDTKKPIAQCPKTLMVESCFDCHIKPSFKLKEARPDAHMDYPYGVQVINGKGYFLLDSINTGTSNQVMDYFNYLRLHKIKHAILDVHSPGGSLFSGWRIKGLINEFQEEGGIVETRVTGFAASAGAILFVAGTRGYRVANPQAELMFHELYTFKFIDISTPSDKEEESRVLRHLQDTMTTWLATRGSIDKNTLDGKMKKREFWLTGLEAKDFGFVDRLVIGK